MSKRSCFFEGVQVLCARAECDAYFIRDVNVKEYYVLVGAFTFSSFTVTWQILHLFSKPIMGYKGKSEAMQMKSKKLSMEFQLVVNTICKTISKHTCLIEYVRQVATNLLFGQA